MVYWILDNIWEKLSLAYRHLLELRDDAEELASEIEKGVMVEEKRVKILYEIIVDTEKHIGDAFMTAVKNKFTPLATTIDSMLRETAYIEADIKRLIDRYTKLEPEMIKKELKQIAINADKAADRIASITTVLGSIVRSLKEAWEKLSRKE